MPNTRLRLLLVEDSTADARLVMYELRQAGFELDATRVDTEVDFLLGLQQAPDVVLCDYNLPQFDAMRALQLVREWQPDVPFLIVSGSIGEEIAVEAIKQGANDYLLKDRLGRLGPAVRQALEERKLRQAERTGREALRASEEQYRVLADSIPQLVWTALPNGEFDYLNKQALDYTGLALEGPAGWSWERQVHPDDLASALTEWRGAIESGEPRESEFRIRRADGTYRWHINRQVTIRGQNGRIIRWLGTCTDIHDQKLAAEQLARDALFLASVHDSVIVTNLEGVVTYWNEGATQLFGWSATEMIGQTYANRFPEPTRTFIAEEIRKRRDGSEWIGEFEDYHKNGSRVWIDARVSRIADVAGRPIGVMGIAHDITGRKRAEEKVRASANFAIAVFDSMTAHIAVLDRAGEIIAVNHSWQAFLKANPGPRGMAPFAGVGANYLRICDRSEAAGCASAAAAARGIREILAGKRDRLSLEYPCHSPNEQRWFLLSVTPLNDVGAVVAHINITDRKLAEESLRAERDRFTTLAANAPGVICSFRQRPDGSITFPYASPGIADLYGLSPEELAQDASAVFDLMNREDAERIKLANLQSARTLAPWRETFRVRRAGVGERWIEGQALPIREPDGGTLWHGFLTDVTERKRNEEVLRLQHALLESQNEASPDGVLVIGLGNRVLSYNRRFLELWGIPQEVVQAGDDEPILAMARSRAANPDAFAARVAAIYADRETRSHDEVRLIDGRTLDRYSGPIRAAGGDLLGRVWFFRDITDRKQAEALLATVMRSVSDAVITIDETGTIGSANPAVERLFGHTPDELIGQKIGILMPDPHRCEQADYLGNYLRTGQARVIGVGREVQARRKDGTTFPADLSVSEFRLDGTRYFTGVIRDVTARKKLENQLRQAQKMDAFGQLAGGVAHDFNNLLTVINGYSDLLLCDFPPADPRRESLTAVREAGERAAGLTAQLLAFSRKTIIEPKILDLNEVVESIAKMLRRLIGEDVRLTLVLSSKLSRVKVDPGQIEQVIMNLAVNARDAMPKGGQLTIETDERIVVGEDAGRYLNCPPGRYVRLNVSDTGCGMTEEVKAKMFEPFFTTKGVGKGTGLGLATVYGIVAQAGGYVGVASELDRGTTFSVLLPPIRESETAPAPVASVQPDRGTETILLVEDEDAVRKLARISLEIHGYKVLEATSGDEAIRLAVGHRGSIHLLLTDVVMPSMGGREVADAMRIKHPAIKVLYMSGYTDDAVVRHGVTEESDPFLQKPYTLLSLARKVRAVLDGTG